jgi:hypothetical protein
MGRIASSLFFVLRVQLMNTGDPGETANGTEGQRVWMALPGRNIYNMLNVEKMTKK